MTPTIRVDATRALIAFDPDVLLIDVRTPGEYETAHIAGSINLPLDQVDAHLQHLAAAAATTMVIICQSGSRAEQCHSKLAAAGLTHMAVMTGGMNAWLTEDGAVIHGQQRWTLERQVGLAAGGIVLASILVSIWLPAARYVAGFIGAGLAIAALTGTCAMGTMLSKLPYNRPRNTTDIRQELARPHDRAGR